MTSRTKCSGVLFLAVALLVSAFCVRPISADDSPINLRKTVVVDVVEKTKNAVVYISTMRTIMRQMNPFFAPLPQRVGSLGSGFIIHPAGYLVTNHHVIEGVREISVELLDGRKFPAELISSDAEADLAILKITNKDPLPALELGDSSDLMIGEPIIAVGNPLGFSHSVSSGIVSALHRTLNGPNDTKMLEDVIQTDAAINPGNSGGPLLNAYAQVIGISTAIRADGQNIGFAIQVNRLRDLIPMLMSPEHVNKSELPIKLTEVRKVTPPSTVHTTVRVEGSNEIVKSIAGEAPKNIIDAYATLLRFKADEPFSLVTDKGKQEITGTAVALSDIAVLSRNRVGLTVEQLTPLDAGRLNIEQEEGVLITDVEPGTVGANAKLQKNDVIIQIDRYRVRNLNDYALLLKLMPKRGTFFVGIVRPGERQLGRTYFTFGPQL